MLISDGYDELDRLVIVRCGRCLFDKLVVDEIVKVSRIAHHVDHLIISQHFMRDGLDTFASFVESDLWEMVGLELHIIEKSYSLLYLML